MKHKELLEQMTLEEKTALCSGKDFWHLNGCERLGLRPIMVSDGPHGLRKHNDKKEKTDIMGSVPAVCFPTASATAASWDEELIYKMGEALGDECKAEKVSVLLGPGNNIKRSPLCGRNFEYFSEDPYLGGKMAASFIKGVQSKGIGTSLKHFAANNQETRRMTIDTIADERTLREIYLASFEIAVKEGKPWTVMNAYNKLLGTYCAENEWLLGQVLREEWGFDGVVVTDWGAENDIHKGIAAGQNLEMPSSNGLGSKKLYDAVKNGELSEEELDERVDEIIDLIMKSQETLGDYSYSMEEHHELAKEVASGSMVLLKNEDNILPLKKNVTVALIGEMAKSPRYQGAGSSQINAPNVDDAFSVMLKKNYGFLYAKGYDKTKDVTDLTLLSEAVETAKSAEIAVIFCGLTEEYESEGFDRDHMKMPRSHIDLITAVSKANPNTVVVLSGGSPVEMPWLLSVKAVLNGYLGGEAGAAAAVELLYGEKSPSGKLAETYPLHLEDTPAYFNFPGSQKCVEYRESIYVGYRYYDKVQKEVLFPFGYGLSYTSFKYSGLKISKKSIKATDTLEVSFKIKNTGDVPAAEIAQLYINDKESTVFRPEKELKGFKKVYLAPGEEKTVKITLDKRAFAYYNVNIHDWHVETGEFTILIGASSRDIKLQETVKVTSTVKNIKIPDLREELPCYYEGNVTQVTDEDFEKLLGYSLPYKNIQNEEITINSALEDAANTKAGKLINELLLKTFKTMSKGNLSQEKMMTSMALQIPIRCFISMSMGVFTPEMAEGLCLILNGKGTMKGLGKIASGITTAVKNIGTLLNSI
ncbi:MAG: glycoside hydrolase family 3 C-terminal domain-containing protein [Clostridia bacterium]|nr:glycoside hydrolase family 3 C-terminal domain-containing protein [Clostridia bacterium]